MIVGYKKVAMMLILHLDKVPESAEIITQVKVSGWPDAADDCFHGAKVIYFLRRQKTEDRSRSRQVAVSGQRSAVSGQKSGIWNLEFGI
jgi:hypothetical protein